jgi:hypothetical protein
MTEKENKGNEINLTVKAQVGNKNGKIYIQN